MTSSVAAAPVEFVLNGRPTAAVPASRATTLLDFLRAHGLTGAKEGCAEGECGACTVAMVASEDGRAAYCAVNSCLVLLPMAAGHEVYTVEGLAEGATLADAQQAMAAGGGSQCGYCTPGFVMSLFAEQYRRDRTGPCDPRALTGNLCRCTGYRPIRDAALALGPPPPGRLRDRLERAAPRIGAVECDGFSRPATVDACVAALAAHPGSTLVAGATDVGVDANLHGRIPAHLVSVESIDELRQLSVTADAVRIGAALPLSEIGRLWHGAPPVVGEWLELFASPPIRNRATLGGNLATASPIGDAAPLLLALDALVHVAGPGGRRTIDLSTFFTGYRRTALQAGEMLTAVEIPTPLPRMVRFYKVAKRRLDDISTVAAAMAMDWDASGRVRRARFVFGGAAPTPVRVHDAESAVTGHPWSSAAVERVQDALDRALSPRTDARGTREYRREVSRSLVDKFFAERP